MIKLYRYPCEKVSTQSYSDEKIAESARSYLGDSTAEVKVFRDSYGKPHIETVGEKLFVSVTHTEDMLLVALAPFDIGIDAEKEGRAVKNPGKLSARYFTPEETDFLGNAPTGADFLDMWVKKEALSKLIGKGVPCMKEFSVFSQEIEIIRQDISGYIVYIAKRKEN